MKTVSLKKALAALGYEVVQYSSGYNYRSGFMMKNDQLYYFSYEDLRDDVPTLLVRTADPTIKDKKGKYADWRGGINTYNSKYELAKIGIEIYEPRNPGKSGIDG